MPAAPARRIPDPAHTAALEHSVRLLTLPSRIFTPATDAMVRRWNVIAAALEIDVSAEQLAGKLGTSIASISRIENCLQFPGAKLLGRIAARTGLRSEPLLRYHLRSRRSRATSSL